MLLGHSAVPDGMRVYAIGDVHGCADLLASIHAAIVADLATTSFADHRIVHLGDYVDRGPASAAVIDRLIGLVAEDPRVICLRGNHEDVLLDFLEDPDAHPAHMARFGVLQTIASYDPLLLEGWPDIGARVLRDRLRDHLPAAHRRFLESLADSVRIGDYFFCHAGIRPGVALDRQTPHDLHWIREEFLHDPRDHGAVVVHGHTPVDAPEIRPNRIGIDTGAVFSGNLTCLVLEGTSYRFLGV